jgi:hypothetical protein
MTLQRMLVSAVVLAMVGTAALADSISPSSYSGDLTVGGEVTIQKTVTVTAGAPTTSMVDVYFLADTTGSMYSAIAAVQAGATAILAGAAGLGDVAFAVGEYKDWDGDPYAYRLNQAMTTVQASAQNGINMWGADGGADTPEAQLFALDQAAGGATGWRAGSSRILVWFGDAPGHDPSPSPGGVSEAIVTAALVANGIEVEALNVGYGGLDDYGQATRITAATGGTLYSGIDAGNIVDTINDAIEEAFQNYSMVSLEAVGNMPGVGVSFSPASYIGTYDRSIERQFTFDVTFTGLDEGTHDFVINALVDRGIVATETDRITVGAIPEPLTAAGLLLGLGCLGRYLRRSR